MKNKTQCPSGQFDFWSMTYRGHEIAVQRHYRGWMVYLNNVILHNVVFFDARSAANWLRRNVDERVVDAT